MATRVLLCCARSFLSVGLRSILNSHPNIDLVGNVDTGYQAAELCLATCPEIVVFDLASNDGDRFNAATNAMSSFRQIGVPLSNGTSGMPRTILILNTPDQAALAAVQTGAAGILLNDCETDELLRAIEIARRGEVYLAPPVARHLVDHIAAGRPVTSSGSAALRELTSREYEVLSMLSEGMSNVEIGDSLYVTEPTIKYHISQILKRLNLRDRVQLVAFAYRNGIVRW